MTERLHHRLKALLKSKGMTQKELSIKTGLTEASISKYLSGARMPNMPAISKLAEALETNADYLLGINHEGKSKYEFVEKIINDNKKDLTSEEKMKLIMLLSRND